MVQTNKAKNVLGSPQKREPLEPNKDRLNKVVCQISSFLLAVQVEFESSGANRDGDDID